MANRDDRPFRGLEPDHYRRSGLKDAVSHYLSPPHPLTLTAPQPFPNNLTMPPAVIVLALADRAVWEHARARTLTSTSKLPSLRGEVAGTDLLRELLAA